MERSDHITPEQDELLKTLQRDSFTYFVHKTNPVNGLVLDKSHEGWPASIAAVGLALASYPGGVECGFMTRDEAVQRTLVTLRFFANAPHGPEPNTTGYKGFYYHFLNMDSGKRAWCSELSSVDTALLLAGMLAAAAYFQEQTAEEDEIRTLADAVYRKADWQWMQNGAAAVSHGWTPERGFLPYRWKGYDEALIIYLLGLGSPTHPAAARELSRLVVDLQVEEGLRHRAPLRRTVVHPSTVARVGRLPRHSRRVHASARSGLFREQSACHSRTAAVRDPQPARTPAQAFHPQGAQQGRGAQPNAEAHSSPEK